MSGWWLNHPSQRYELVNWENYSQYMDIYIYIYVDKTNHVPGTTNQTMMFHTYAKLVGGLNPSEKY